MRVPGVSSPTLVAWGFIMVLATVAAQQTDPITSKTTITKTKPKCCNTKLMDSAGYTMIEANTPLPVGIEIKALLLTMCSPVDIEDTFAILILKRTPGTSGPTATYSVSWMMSVTTDKNEATGKEEKIVKKLSESYTTGPDEYLALWSKEANRIPIPFDFDATNTSYAFYLSDGRYTSSENFALLKHTDHIRWPRTFRNYILFCETIDCEDKDVTILRIVGPPGKEGPVGPKGPPGDPGQNIFIGQDDIGGQGLLVTCDVPNVEDKVDETKETIEILSNQVSQMQQALDSIYNSNSVTGICPTGMVAGTYGVGSCYIIRKELVQMGVAELLCRTDFDAHLISVETEIEERFIRNEILKLATNISLLSSDKAFTEQFWTAAVFNKNSKTWIWYNEARLKQPVLQYTNWQTGFPPLPRDDQEVCATFNVNRRLTTSDWHSSNCNKHKFYICEVPKKCL